MHAALAAGAHALAGSVTSEETQSNSYFWQIINVPISHENSSPFFSLREINEMTGIRRTYK